MRARASLSHHRRGRALVVVAALTTATYVRADEAGVAPPSPRSDPEAAAPPGTVAVPPNKRAAPVVPLPLPLPLAPAAGEPAVDVLCKAAVDLALADPERARGFVRRARLAGWLPEVTFRAYRRFARTEGLSFSDAAGGTVAPVDISSIDDVRYEWRASLDLSRMVFNPDELQAHSEALRMSDVRREIQSLVIRLYYERRRLLLEARTSAPAGAADSLGAERRLLRIGEIEAQLDALSDGAFSAPGASRHEATSSP